MLENATVAISPKAPTPVKASPAVEYSRAANIACSTNMKLPQCSAPGSVCCVELSGAGRESHQPAGEGVGLEGFCMPYEKDLIFRGVGPHVAEQLKERILGVLW